MSLAAELWGKIEQTTNMQHNDHTVHIGGKDTVCPLLLKSRRALIARWLLGSLAPKAASEAESW